MAELGVLAGMFVLYALVSRRLTRTVVTAPMAFVSAGLILGVTGVVDFGFGSDEGAFEFALGNEIVLVIAELALVLVLFTDASRINLGTLRGNAVLPARLLGVGMPLSIVLGLVLALPLITDLEFWEAAVIAAVLAPTDAALGHAVVSSKRVPARIRQALNIESGLNDGLAVPLLTIFIALAAAEEAIEGAGFWIRFALEQIGYGAALGVGVGVVGGALIQRACQRDWVAPLYEQLSVAALPIVAWAAADAVGGNGFIAAFVTGLAVSRTVGDLGEKIIDFTEDEGQLLNLSIFFIFGALAASVMDELTWQLVLYGVLSLTVVRMLPVAVASVGTGLSAPTVAFLGWFGPRGLASIILALVVFEEEAAIAGAKTIFLAMTITVLLSVFAHGISARPLIKLYGRHVEKMDDEAPEMEEVPEVRMRG
ncbi:MAG: cation:proton antiporter [Gaiellaceae bacterium]